MLSAVLCSLAWSGNTVFGDTLYETSPAWSGSQSVAVGETVEFQNCLFGQTGALTVDVDGKLILNLSTGSAQSLATSAENSVTFTGGGTIVKEGTDALYSAAGNYALTIAMDAGGTIDIQNGQWVNGHWQQQYWKNNQGNINIGSSGTFHLWDGGDVYCAQLTGSGTVTRNDNQDAIKYSLNVGVNDASSTFDGKFTSHASLTKIGAGTLTLTGANSQSGTSNRPSLWVSAGTVAVTGSGTPAGGGTIQVDKDALLSFQKEGDYYFGGTLTGTGNVEINSKAVGFKVAKDFTGTITLNDAILRNAYSSTEYNANVILNGTSGFNAGWASQVMTVNGKVSCGTGSTLYIYEDSNKDDVASWVYLTNPENSQTATVVDHYLRIGSAGALGTGTVTVKSGKVLDLNGCDFDDDRLASSGIVTNLNAEKLSTVTFSSAPTNTFQGNIKLVFDGTSGSDLTWTVSNSHTEGTELNDCKIRVSSSTLGSGTVTLNNGTIFNNNNSPEIKNAIVLGAKGGGLRVGWNSAGCVLTISGDISGEGKMTFNNGESNPSILVLSGNNTWSGGSTFAGGTTNYLTLKSSNALGTGVVDTNGKNVQITFDTANTDISLSNPWKISSTGVTIKNSAGGDATLSGKTTGSQTFAVTENKGRFIFNGAPAADSDAFSVSVAEGTFTGNGTIGKNLDLAAGTTLEINEEELLGNLTVNGALNAAGSILDVALTGADDSFGISANSVDFANAVFNIVYAGESAPETEILVLDFIQTKDEAPSWEGATFELSALDSDVSLAVQFANGNYSLLVGNSASLPEPGAWLLLLFGVFGIWAVDRNRRSRRLKNA